MKRILIGFLCCLSLAGVARAQQLTYEKYQLPNGMTVILHEDHSLPVAGVNLWYYVGSKDEPAGRSGFAHLFEHLMFMGTERVPDLDFDRIMEAGGGWNNATTSADRTNYFEMGPSELLPTLLWLEADRLEALGRAMTQEKLDKQRDVVRNERRQVYENRPYGNAELKINELMFPKGHPYHIPVIGTHEDLEAATVDDVKNFFATWYVPSNASLVVAGDFDPNEIKPLIERLFGTMPRGSDVVHAKARPVTLDGVTRLTTTDNVQFARSHFVYHSPPRFAPGDAEMDLNAAILADGISSRLYQKLIYENDLAVEVNAYQASMLLGSMFYIEVTARPEVSLDTVEAAVDDVLADYRRTGPTAEELERQKARVEYGMVTRLQSLLARADLLNTYQFFFDEPDALKRDIERYRQATTDGLKTWANKVLTPDARLILRVIPEIRVAEANPRDEQPPLASTKSFSPLEPQTFKLTNGLTVHHWERRDLPLISAELLLPFGAADDPPAKAGLATLTADMLDEGAGKLDAVAFADALDLLGANFSTNTDQESTRARLSTLSRNADAALGLYADAILRPRFDEKEWERVHKLHLQELIRSLDEPAYVAQTVSQRAFFGDGHPYGRPSDGTVASVERITLDDVRHFHRRVFNPAGAVLLLAGDLGAGDVRTMLEKHFGAWKDASGSEAVAGGPARTLPALPDPVNQSLRVVLIDRPDAVQTVIRFVMPAPPYASPQRPRLELISTVLGGTFTSRLNQNLREDKGYTYGARSSFTMQPSVGYFVAGSSVRADVTGPALREFLKEFAGLRGGNISEEEGRKARAARRMSMVQMFQGLSGILSAGSTMVRNGRPFTELGAELDLLARVSETEMNRLAYDAVPLERGLLVLVGDRKTILTQIEGLDLPTPEELTVSGDPKP